MRKSRQNRTQNQKQGIWIFLVVLLVCFVISAGGSYLYFRDRFAFESEFIADIESQRARVQKQNQGGDTQRLYISEGDNEQARQDTLSRKDAVLVTAEDFIREYLSPYQVGLHDLYLDRDGVIYIDFNSSAKKNLGGDVAGELQIIAGLYKGIKSVVPGLSAMKILIEGKEADSIGGHIDISRPIREIFVNSVEQ